MDNNYYEVVNDFLNLTLNNLIINKQIELDDLKTILLICYNYLVDKDPDQLTYSLLVTNLKRIVDIENYCKLQNQPKEWNEDNIDRYIESIVHPRVFEIRNQLKDKE